MTDALERAAREIAKLFIPAYESDIVWQEDLPMYRRRYERQMPLGQDNPIGAARAAILAFLDAPELQTQIAEALAKEATRQRNEFRGLQGIDLESAQPVSPAIFTRDGAAALSALRAAAGGEG